MVCVRSPTCLRRTTRGTATRSLAPRGRATSRGTTRTSRWRVAPLEAERGGQVCCGGCCVAAYGSIALAACACFLTPARCFVFSSSLAVRQRRLHGHLLPRLLPRRVVGPRDQELRQAVKWSCATHERFVRAPRQQPPHGLLGGRGPATEQQATAVPAAAATQLLPRPVAAASISSHERRHAVVRRRRPDAQGARVTSFFFFLLAAALSSISGAGAARARARPAGCQPRAASASKK